jgi:hypothetical protein
VVRRPARNVRRARRPPPDDLEALQELVRYWGTGYDWRKAEANLNALPRFKTRSDGVDIHFIHVGSRHPNALPLIITHGWPGSVFEQIKLIGPLTDPDEGTAAGRRTTADTKVSSIPSSDRFAPRASGFMCSRKQHEATRTTDPPR